MQYFLKRNLSFNSNKLLHFLKSVYYYGLCELLPQQILYHCKCVLEFQGSFIFCYHNHLTGLIKCVANLLIDTMSLLSRFNSLLRFLRYLSSRA